MTPARVELFYANAFIRAHHRHHREVTGHRFSLGVKDRQGVIRGVAICGRPVARRTSQTEVLEVTRLCTDGTKNACSMLYSMAYRIAKEMGFSRIQTFILDSENGTTLLASGWKFIGVSPGGYWTRNSLSSAPSSPKQLWVKEITYK